MQVVMIYLNLLLYPRCPLGGARMVLRAIEHKTIHHSGYCLGRCTTAINLLYYLHDHECRNSPFEHTESFSDTVWAPLSTLTEYLMAGMTFTDVFANAGIYSDREGLHSRHCLTKA